MRVPAVVSKGAGLITPDEVAESVLLIALALSFTVVASLATVFGLSVDCDRTLRRSIDGGC